MNVLERAKAPTPRFFKKLRNIGLALTAAAGVVMASPIALPTTLVTVAGYVAMAGGVVSAVCQITTSKEPIDETADRDKN